MTACVAYTKLQKSSALTQTRPNIILKHIMRSKRVRRDCKFSKFNMALIPMENIPTDFFYCCRLVLG